MQEIFTIPTIISILGFGITIGTLIFKANRDKENYIEIILEVTKEEKPIYLL